MKDEENTEFKEEKKEDETSESEAQADEKKEGEESEKSEEASGDVDYESEFKKLSEENEKLARDRDNYKQGLLAEKDKTRKKSNRDDDSSEGNDGESDEPLTNERVAEIIREENRKVIFAQTQDTIQEVLSEMAGSESERKLMAFHYENTIRPSGHSRADIVRDITRAKMLANSAKIKVNLSEAKRKIESEQTKNRKQSSSGIKGEDTFDPTKLSDADRALLERHNLKPTDVKPAN